MADINFGWNDAIENDGQEQEALIVVPEGDYDFRIVDFQRAKAKSGANMAHVTMRVESNEGASLIHEYIVLTSSQEWKISAFFRAIGQKKRGERVTMDWTKVNGARGRAHVIVDKFKRNDGTDGESNKISRYIDFAQANESAIKFGDDIKAELMNDDDDMPF